MKKLNIINLTPHPIAILKKEFLPYKRGEERKSHWVKSHILEPSDLVISCPSVTEEEAIVVNTQDGIVPLTCTTYHRPKDLPPFIKDTIYIVSDVVARLCPDRPDFRIVNGLIREQGGRVIGCRSLGRIKPQPNMEGLKRIHRILCSIDNPTDDETMEAELSNAIGLLEIEMQSIAQKD